MIIITIITGVIFIYAMCCYFDNGHKKELIFDCENGDTYKLKFCDANDFWNDVECKVYKMKLNGKYKKVYSSCYCFTDFPDMKEMGKDAIAHFIYHENEREEKAKAEKNFWGN